MGHDPQLKFTVTGMVLVQLLSAYALRDCGWPLVVLVAYCWGGVINHSMTLAIHEMSHNVAFGHTRPLANRALEIFGNVILGVPYAAAFRKYHAEHHRYQVRISFRLIIQLRPQYVGLCPYYSIIHVRPWKLCLAAAHREMTDIGGNTRNVGRLWVGYIMICPQNV